MTRRPPLTREFVEAHRRRRFALAAAEIAHESGVSGVTATRLCQMARSARNTFYDLFPNVNACLRYGLAEAFDRLFAPVRGADEEGEWLMVVEQAIACFYAAVAAEPLLAELFLVHSFGVELGAGDPGFDTGVEAVAQLLDRGRVAAKDGGHEPPPPLTEEYLARVIVSLAALKIRQGDSGGLPAHSREMGMLVGSAYPGPQRASPALADTPHPAYSPKYRAPTR